MKKATELKNFLTLWWENKSKKEVTDLKDNERNIMYLLTWGNGSRLTTKQRIEIYDAISLEFNNTISKVKNDRIAELKAINKFDGSDQDKKSNDLQKRVKEHVNNPIFDIPVNEYEIIDFEKK